MIMGKLGEGNLDIVFEILFEIIFEGFIEIAGAKKVPMILRILATLIVGAFYIVISGIFIFIGIKQEQPIIIIIGIFIFALCAALLVKQIKKRANR